MKKNLPISNVELNYSDNANILSTTDLKGAISYFNKDFLDISGFEVDELTHKNHNVVRHPEMPPPPSRICGAPSKAATPGWGSSRIAARMVTTTG